MIGLRAPETESNPTNANGHKQKMVFFILTPALFPLVSVHLRPIDQIAGICSRKGVRGWDIVLQTGFI